MESLKKTINHFFPKLESEIEAVCEDPRRKKSTTYSLPEIILAAVYMYMMRQGSRNSCNENRKTFNFKRNYKSLLGLKLPHMDTVNDVLEKLEEDNLDRLRMVLVKHLLKKRTLHKYRLQNKYFTIAIDGTGVYWFDKEPYPGCPYKTSKKGKVTYSQSVLEAKLITSNGFALSIATEWIINEDGKTKQDCEYNACIRLMIKLKENYSRLPICLLLDGLYAKYPIISAIKRYGWEYIIVWKDKTFYKQQDQVTKLRAIGKVKEIHKDICHNVNCWTKKEYEYCEEPLNLRGQKIFYMCLKESHHRMNNQEDVDITKFVFMTNILTTRSNIEELIAGGRLRWKIENEGFNIQKNGGYALHHKMNRKNIRAIKNYYVCLQLAHIIDQLHNKSKEFRKNINVSIRKLWEYFCSALSMLDSMPNTPQKTKYNYRY